MESHDAILDKRRCIPSFLQQEKYGFSNRIDNPASQLRTKTPALPPLTPVAMDQHYDLGFARKPAIATSSPADF